MKNMLILEHAISKNECICMWQEREEKAGERKINYLLLVPIYRHLERVYTSILISPLDGNKVNGLREKWERKFKSVSALLHTWLHK